LTYPDDFHKKTLVGISIGSKCPSLNEIQYSFRIYHYKLIWHDGDVMDSPFFTQFFKDHRGEIDGWVLNCPICKGGRIDIISGKELGIVEIEGES